jgi:hypothetical protein
VLFDLQSPGRRRVVRIVFGGLAAIFAISFVFLGVGTGGSGFSISDLFGSGGDADVSSAFDDDISAAEQKLEVNPNDTVALSQLVTLHYQAGIQGVDENGALTSEGQQQLEQSVDSWNKYLKASNGNPDTAPATISVQAYDALATTAFQAARTSTSVPEALQSVNTAVAGWKGAADAQQILIDKRPTSSSYLKLAYYLYLSGDSAGGDQAAAQAKATAKGGEADQIDSQLKPIKELGTQLQTAIDQLTKQQQAQGGGATGGGENPLGGLGGGVGGTGALGGQ